MNYRHAYHAGSFADVFKHAVLALLIEALKRKDTPFCAIDTHAGIGRYDLESVEAGKTNEADTGIRKLTGLTLPPELAAYAGAVAALNPDPSVPRWYPGSPLIVRHLLRPQDRLLLAELHPADAAQLATEFHRDPQTLVRHMDGYVALKAFLPPAERRGVVLIDPPFEVTNEFVLLQKGLSEAWRRWPTGIYAVWYPIKAWAPIAAFHEWVKANAPGPALFAQLLLYPLGNEERLNGCGLVIVRPPWQLDHELGRLLPFLRRTLAPELGQTDLTWLVKDRA